MAKSVARERRARFKAPARSPAATSARPNLYDRDMYRWTREQARLLRAGKLAELDLANLAEEIESLGNRDQREVRSRLALILMHILKWRFQPDKRTRSWLTTIVTQRQELEGIFEQSPSLRRRAALMLEKSFADAVRQAVSETGLPRTTFPDDPPLTIDQTLDPDYMPED